MATSLAVIDGLDTVLSAALSGLQVDGGPVSVRIGEGWPPVAAIQAISKKNEAVIGLYERPSAGLITKFFPRRALTEQNPTGIKSTVNGEMLLVGGTRTVTLSYAEGSSAVNLNDAVSLVLDVETIRYGAVATAAAGETLATLATKLAAEINATATMNGFVSASSAGAVVTLTGANKLGHISSFVGNIGTIYTSVGQMQMHCQAVCFFGRKSTRRAVCDQLELKFASMRASSGFNLASPQEFVRLTDIKPMSAMHDDAEAMSDIFRRDYLLELQYALTKSDLAYSVLVPKADRELF